MSNSLGQLTEKRKRWVEANRENGFEDGIKRLLTELYPDNAHFIYELLQNAEDTQASEVYFTLNNNELEFEHDGTRLFSFENVDSITSIGVSSKRDDPTSIGKFGVGFKAVFAYTNTPEIHSGDYHFRIDDLVVPEPVKARQMGERATKFVFPFNHPKKATTQAETEITKGLRELGDNTLLFLKHIHKIEFLLPDESLGSQKRIKHENGHIEIHTLRPDGAKLVSHWQRFEQVVKVTDEEGKEKDCRIAIAYSLTNSAKNDEPPAWKVTPLEHGQVSIFFPAEKETSNLRFHIHAPFASTVARDSVRDCEANKALLSAIAELTANKLEHLRDLGLLNVASYTTLPLRAQDFPEGSMFRPVYDRVREALKTQPLLLTQGGSFVKADGVKLARGKELVELFSPQQLGSLFGRDRLVWLEATITESGETADLHAYLISLVDGMQVTPEALAPKLTADFLSKQEMGWLIPFIQYAIDGAQKLKEVPLIRLASGGHVSLPSEKSTPPSAWFPPKDTIGVNLSEFPLIHAELAANEQIKKFLKKEGIREIDAAAIVGKCILPLYNGKDKDFDETVYREHLRQIRKAYTEANEAANDAAKKQLTTNLDGVGWLACIHASGNAQDKIAWKKPGASDVFTRTNDHETWFHGLDSVGAYFLHPSVTDELNGVVSNLVKPAAALTHNLHPSESNVILLNSNGGHKRGLNGFKPDATIVGLGVALEDWNTERARILWEIMLFAPRIISGETQRESNFQRLDGAPKKLEFTEVGKLCRDWAWLPDKSGERRKPSELSLSDLPDGFDTTSVRAKEVADKLGMKRPVSSETIEALGFSSEDELRRAQAIVQSPDEFRAFEEFRRRRQEEVNYKPALPNKTSPDSKRREEKIAEEARTAPEKTQETRDRTVDPDYDGAQGDARTYLKHQYTNDDGVMFCQLCQARQPVMLNGKPYFEAVDCVSGINAHHEHNNLALCPNHAAMYKNGGLVPDVLQRAILECEGQEIPLYLAGNQEKLYFTQQHLADLQAVLAAATSAKLDEEI